VTEKTGEFGLQDFVGRYSETPKDVSNSSRESRNENIAMDIELEKALDEMKKEEPKQPKSAKKLLIMLGVVATVFVAVSFLFVNQFLTGNDEEKENKKEGNTNGPENSSVLSETEMREALQEYWLNVSRFVANYYNANKLFPEADRVRGGVPQPDGVEIVCDVIEINSHVLIWLDQCSINGSAKTFSYGQRYANDVENDYWDEEEYGCDLIDKNFPDGLHSATRLYISSECRGFRTSCARSIIVGDEEVEIALVKGSGEGDQTITINGVEVYEYSIMGNTFISYVEVYKDYIIIPVASCSYRSLHVFRTDGQKVFEVDSFDFSKEFEDLEPWDEEVSYYRIEGDKIILYGFRHSLIWEERTKICQNQNEVIAVIYEINYLGDGKFSAPTRIETRTVRQTCKCS